MTTPYTYATSRKDYFHQPQTQAQRQQTRSPLLSEHHVTFEEHANAAMQTAQADDNAVNHLLNGRRESVIWAEQSASEDDAPKFNRNPMMPQALDAVTPPTIEKLVRRTTGDSTSTRRSSLVQSDAVFSRPSTIRSSITGNETDSWAQVDKTRSTGGLPKNTTDSIPALRRLRSSAEEASQPSVQDQILSQEMLPNQRGNKTRKLSFQLPVRLRSKGSSDKLHKQSLVVDQPSIRQSPGGFTVPDLNPSCGGLAARRQVKMDLALPVGLSDLSQASDHKGTHPAVLSSITASRRRSPKTPWLRNTEPIWGQGLKAKSTKVAPVVKKKSDSLNTDNVNTLDKAGVEPSTETALPLATPPLVTPSFVRPPQKIRDRCYTSRPLENGNRTRSRNTSDSDFADGNWTPKTPEGLTSEEAQAQKEFLRLAKTANSARTRRWPWKRFKLPAANEDTKDVGARSISVNIFKRSNRFPESQNDETKEKRSTKTVSTPRRREKPADKPPLPSASLANMLVPPTFVPPGSEKVSTPPTFDLDREVKGKLADFFFDTNGIPRAKRKQKASSSGYWDSNAVLMSMHTDLGLTNDEDEEGPEGRPAPSPFPSSLPNDTPGLISAPGFLPGPDGYIAVGSPLANRPLLTTGEQDSWLRMHYSDRTHDTGPTAAALQEEDERRKFEWLVPEHLPNSPICPLHTKYVGPSKGLCYWHGRKSNGWGVEPGRDYVKDPVRIGQGNSRGWEMGKTPKSPQEPKRKRRLESFVDAG